MKMRTIMFVCLLLLVGSSTNAGVTSGTGTIKMVNIRADGTVMRIDFSQPIQNPDGCGAAEFYVRELGTDAGSNRFVAAVLSAYMANRQVSFFISGCTQNPYWGATRPMPFDIYIRE